MAKHNAAVIEEARALARALRRHTPASEILLFDEVRACACHRRPISRPNNPRSEHAPAMYLAPQRDQIECLFHLVYPPSWHIV